MKILIATGLFPPDIGGPATYSKILVEELPKRGVDVVVISFGSVRDLPKIIRHAAYFWKVVRSGRDADVIYAQDPVSAGLPAYLAARFLGKPFYVRIAGDYAWEQGVARFGVTLDLDQFVKEKKVPFAVRMLRYIQITVASGAKKVIVPSEYLKGIVRSWGVKGERIAVIYSVFEGVVVKETKEELRQKLGFSGNILVSAGRLVLWKGFEKLISLIPSIHEKVADVHL